MAITLGDAILWLRANADGLNQGLNDAESKTQGWAQKLGANIPKLLGGAVVAGTTAAIDGVAAIGTKAFQVSDEVRNAALAIQGDLGTTADEAQRLADLGLAVFGNNFAGSITEAAQAVGLVRQQLGDLGDADLQDATENAFRLRDAWGVDVSEGLSAARTLMENFGLTQQEAFDMLASGFQRGLNRSDDFLDTVNEYSIQFANAGASSAEFFGLLESGLAGGNLGTDKAADLFKEFFIRIQDGSKTTRGALEQLGLDAEILDGLSDGTYTAADAFGILTGAVANVEDPIQRAQIGVALFGTQFEDLGQSLGSLDLIPDAFESVTGAIDSVDARYQSFGAMWEGITRKGAVALRPLGDELLKIANEAMPYVEQAFAWMSDNLPGIISTSVEIVRTGVDFIKRLFSGELTQGLGDGLGAFQVVKDWIDENMPLIQQTIQTILGAIQRFWDEHGATIMRIVNRTFGMVQTTIESILGIVLGIVRAVMLAINGDWAGAWEELKNVTEIWLNAIKTILSTVLQNYVDLVLAIGPSLYNAGRAIIENLWQGISGRFDQLMTDARSKWQDFVDWLPGSEPKNASSPFRNLGQRGAAIVENLQAGLDRASLDLGGLAPMAAGGTGGSVVVNQYFGNGDATGVRSAARDGVLSAMRAQGMR